MPVAVRPSPARAVAAPLVCALLTMTLLLPVASVNGDEAGVDHLVLSEVVTGGGSASDELIELYNPTAAPLPLEGLELVYVTASGATISRRAAWAVGAPSVPAGGHVLVAHEAGVYASIADVTYASGMAATGGSAALRIQGASTAIDAVGWGTAASTWMEGTPVSAPATGASIERLPGGASGSTIDTDDNAADFVSRLVPDPQNLGSTPVPDPNAPLPTPTPSPSASPSSSPSTNPIPTATASPDPTVVSIADARTAPDGSKVTIEGTAITGSDFHDGGGFVTDPTAGIAVMLDDGGTFQAGSSLRISGTVDDRFSQRTLRASPADVSVLGTAGDPATQPTPTGFVDEAVEGELVRIAGQVTTAPSVLTTALAFDVDDGSGAVRVVVGKATGIDAASWSRGTVLELVGVVGQRDSSGSGIAGYRLMPRGPGDVVSVGTASPSPSATPSGSAEPSPTPSAGPSASVEPDPAGAIPIAEARGAAKNARVRVRGVVTMATGIVDPVTAVVQDATGAIVLRLGDDVGPLALGERVGVLGVRSTLKGMETLRVTQAIERLGTAADPGALSVRTGDAGEAQEATLVLARGALVAAARRVASGTVSFEIDDGSGPLRVVLPAALDAGRDELTAGTWVEVRGVLGQETTGAQPLRGYRIWPRAATEVRVVAAGPTDEGAGDADDAAAEAREADGSAAAAGSLDLVGRGADLTGLRIGATLVVGPWEEAGVGGILWDGTRVVAVDRRSAPTIEALVGSGAPPIVVALTGLTDSGIAPTARVPLVWLDPGLGRAVRADGAPAAPRATLRVRDGQPAWVSVIGRLAGPDDALRLIVGSSEVPVEHLCDGDVRRPSGQVGATGILVGEATRMLVPCDGFRSVPALARAGLEVARTRADPEPAGAATPTSHHETDRRPLVVALLLLAAMALGGGAAARWWSGRTPTAAVDHGVPEPGVPDEPASPARLTLVAVPPERRSP